MPFFSPPLEANDAGLRVTEDAPYRWTWPEIGKAVGVPEVSVSSHSAIMPDFQTPSHTDFTPLFPRRCRFSRFVYPLTKEKSQENKASPYTVTEKLPVNLILAPGISDR